MANNSWYQFQRRHHHHRHYHYLGYYWQFKSNLYLAPLRDLLTLTQHQLPGQLCYPCFYLTLHTIYHQQAAQQTVELPVISDTVTLIWHYYNALSVQRSLRCHRRKLNPVAMWVLLPPIETTCKQWVYGYICLYIVQSRCYSFATFSR